MSITKELSDKDRKELAEIYELVRPQLNPLERTVLRKALLLAETYGQSSHTVSQPCETPTQAMATTDTFSLASALGEVLELADILMNTAMKLNGISLKYYKLAVVGRSGLPVRGS